MKIKREGRDNFNIFRTLVLVGIKAIQGPREGGRDGGRKRGKEGEAEGGERAQEPESVNSCSISAVAITLLVELKT